MVYTAHIELEDGAQTERRVDAVVGFQAAYRAAKELIREGEILRGVTEGEPSV